MKYKRFFICSVFLLVSTTFGDLTRDVRNIVEETNLHKGKAGIYFLDTATGKTLVDINASNGMIPASNQKLLTTGAAIDVLGADFVFETKLLKKDNDLYLVGDGDPTFGDTQLHGKPDWQNERQLLADELRPWILSIKHAGLTEVDTLWVDDRIFDRNFIHPSWPSDQINNYYCAQVSGLNYHLNVFHFFPSPNPGSTASLGNYTPVIPWVSIGNRTTSKTGSKNKSSFWVARSPNSNKITARGNVKATHTSPVQIAFHDAGMVLGETIAATLRLNGIQVKQVKRVPDAAPPSEGELLFLRRTPLDVVLQKTNEESYNLYAESLLKRIAAEMTKRPGTFDEGALTVEGIVEKRLGSEQRGLRPADGSGMSRDNSVSPKTLALFLESFSPKSIEGSTLLNSLPIPGVGTLRTRFTSFEIEGATVHAKSGYIREVCSLSGYVTFDNGRAPLVFSFIVNGVKGSVRNAKKMQEVIIEHVCKHTLD